MKPEPIAPGAGTFYTGAANEPSAISLPPAPPPPLPARRDPSPDRHGAMATQLRDTLRGAAKVGASEHPSPTTSVHSVAVTPLRPVTLAAHRQALQDIENKAMDYLQRQRPAHQELLRSWPSEMTYKEVEATFQKHWEEALEQAGHQALLADALSPHEERQAVSAEEEMTERVGDHILAHFNQQGWSMNPKPEGLKWGTDSPLTLLRNGDFASVQANTAAPERAGEHGIVRFLSTPLRQLADEVPARAELALKQPHGDGWNTAHREMAGYKKIVDEVGLHPNLMVPLGQARVNNVSGLLLMAVPGSVGGAFLGALERARQQGKISASDVEQVLALVLQRGLAVIDHCRRASVCISDMKPDNFIIDERTGEPVFHDLGLWTLEGEVATGSTRRYAPPEASPEMDDVVDHRSDMSGLVASLADAIGGGQLMYRHGPEGRVDVTPNLIDADDQDGVATIRHPADARETPLWQFASRLMYREVDGQPSMRKEDRMPMEEALENVKVLRAGHDEAHVLDIMKRLSHEAAREDARPAG